MFHRLSVPALGATTAALLLLLTPLLSSDALSAPPADAAVVVDSPAAAAPGEPAAAPDPRANLSPMLREIFDAWDAHVVAVEALEARLAQTTAPAEALALQRQVETVREQVEIQILQIQARYARAEGRMEAVAEIEAAIAVMTAPAPRGEPIDRGASGPESR